MLAKKPKQGDAGMMPRRMRPISTRRSAVLCVLDVGTSKIACLIAKLVPGRSLRHAARADASLPYPRHRPPALARHQGRRRRRHGRGREAPSASRSMPPSAWRASRSRASWSLRRAGASPPSTTAPRSASAARPCPTTTSHRVLEAASATTARQGRAVLHSLPTGFSLDQTRGIQRSARHDRRRTRRRHARDRLRYRGRPQPDARHRALPPHDRGHRGHPLRGGPVGPGRRRGRDRRRPGRHGRRHHLGRRLRGRSPHPCGCRRGGRQSMSPWTSPAG